MAKKGVVPIRQPIGELDKKTGMVRLDPVWERFFTLLLQPSLDVVSSGTIGVENGGTGLEEITDHAFMLGSGTDPVSTVGPGGAGQIPIGVPGADPSMANLTPGDGVDITNRAGSIEVDADLKENGGLVFEATEIGVDLGASDITGTLGVTDGGTGVQTLTDGGAIYGSGTNPVTVLPRAADGEIAIGSIGADPVIDTITGSTPVKVTNAPGKITLDINADGIDDTHINWGSGANQVSAVDVPVLDAGAYYDGTELEAVTQEVGQELLQHNLGGFEDASLVALSSDAGTPPTLTLTFTGTVGWWSEGIRYTDTGTDDIQIGDATGLHYIYYDGATLTSVANPGDSAVSQVITNKALVAIIYWNTVEDEEYFICNELHGVQMSGVTHAWLHFFEGAQWGSGATLSGYTLESALDADISFDLTDIMIQDEDISISITDGTPANQYEQVLTGDAEIPVLYRDASNGGIWREQLAASPGLKPGPTLPYLYDVDGNGRIAYMDVDNVTPYTLTEVSNGDYCNYWLVATNDWQYPVKMIPGTQTYTNNNDANNNAHNEIIELGALPGPEIVVLYRLLMRDRSGGTTDAAIWEIEDYRGQSISGVSAGSATDHGNLSGLQGGVAGEYYHLLSAEYTELSNFLDDAVLGSDGQISVPQAVLVPRAAALNNVQGGMFYSSVDDSIYVCTSDA